MIRGLGGIAAQGTDFVRDVAGVIDEGRRLIGAVRDGRKVKRTKKAVQPVPVRAVSDGPGRVTDGGGGGGIAGMSPAVIVALAFVVLMAVRR